MEHYSTATRDSNTLHTRILSLRKSITLFLLCLAVAISGTMHRWRISSGIWKRRLCGNSRCSLLKTLRRLLINIFTFTTVNGYNWNQDRHLIKPGACLCNLTRGFLFVSCLMGAVHSIVYPLFYLLTHRVSHWMPTNQMHMNMEDRLIGIRTGIDDHTKAWFMNTLLFSDLASDSEQVTNQVLILQVYLIDRDNMFVRNNKYMTRRNRMDIVESCCLLVLVNYRPRAYPCNNLTESALIHNEMISPKNLSVFNLVRWTGVIWFHRLSWLIAFTRR